MVAQRWKLSLALAITQARAFQYPLSLHLLRHRQWFEPGTDFNSKRAQKQWAKVGTNLSRYIFDSLCISNLVNMSIVDN